MASRGYDDAYLSAQETRVRFFHEVLNDWLDKDCATVSRSSTVIEARILAPPEL